SGCVAPAAWRCHRRHAALGHRPFSIGSPLRCPLQLPEPCSRERRMTGLFVTGTDTGVGKTYVTAGLVRLLRSQGRAVRVCKPVATGARRVGERWVGDDTVCLAEAAGMADNWDEVTGWTFPDPVAPPVAAARQGLSLTLSEIANAVRQRSRSGVPI